MSAFYSLIIAALFISPSIRANREDLTRLHGISLPAGSKPLGESRFQSSRNYEDTVKDIKQRLKNIKISIHEINLPHVRATCLINNNPDATFLSVNIHLNAASGITEIFFVNK